MGGKGGREGGRGWRARGVKKRSGLIACIFNGRYVVIGAACAYDGNASIKLYARCTLGRERSRGSLDSTAAVFIPPDGSGGKGWRRTCDRVDVSFFSSFFSSFFFPFLFRDFRRRLAEGDEVSIVLSGSEVLMKS